MKTRFFLSLLALAFGGVILFTSLAMAPAASSNGAHTSSERSLYFGSILPDHVFYPVVMAVDRLQLETASPSERIFMEVEYAHRRLGYAEELLKDKKEDLAVSTITKAEKYLYNSLEEAKEFQSSDSIRQRIGRAIEYHSKELRELSPQLTDANRAIIDRTLEQNQAVLQSL